MNYKDAMRQVARQEGYDEDTITDMIRNAELHMPGVGSKELAPEEVEPTLQRIRERHRAMRAMTASDRAVLMREAEVIAANLVNRVN
jgi:hypothetical protein